MLYCLHIIDKLFTHSSHDLTRSQCQTLLPLTVCFYYSNGNWSAENYLYFNPEQR